MYRHILIPLENSATDRVILEHIKPLVRLTGARVLLLHVADGWVARNFNRLNLAESEEMRQDRAYLEKTAGELRAEGFSVTTELALGNPPEEILKAAEVGKCDLIAMASHGHRFLGDFFHGSTITEVRHKTSIPILVVREEKARPKRPPTGS
jgi:nucleotide-binding universal stress UspA family protein